MQFKVLSSIAEISASEWNQLDGTAQPFLCHEFLATLEETHCVGRNTGWQPSFLVARTPLGALHAALPLYLKTHSFGEFVFDWAWADAYHQAGLPYYPKLVSAVPFTPVQGNRILLHPDADINLTDDLLDKAEQLTQEQDCSSLHVLFPHGSQLSTLEDHGYMLRKDCQFHWTNSNYRDFDEYLSNFSASKRKKVKRERRRISEAGIEIRQYEGKDLAQLDWEHLHELYAATFHRYGRAPYFTPQLFPALSERIPEHLLVITAALAGELIATAIFFRDERSLYGRYWGSSSYHHSLHFELCYYQGIDYCIRKGLQRFEPGTQGEHKIVRGFVPQPSWSAHRVTDIQFAEAIRDYLRRERALVDEYIEAVQNQLPFRQKYRESRISRDLFP